MKRLLLLFFVLLFSFSATLYGFSATRTMDVSIGTKEAAGKLFKDQLTEQYLDASFSGKEASMLDEGTMVREESLLRSVDANPADPGNPSNLSSPLPSPMVLIFDTSLGTAGTTITLPLNGTVNVTIDWGDGTTQNETTQGSKSHTYSNSGTYTVTISGSLTGFGFASTAIPNIAKLTAVTSFGDLGLTSLSGAFNGASNLTAVPASLPSTVTNLSYLFNWANKFNGAIGSWDVSNVTNMSNMFYSATVFNQDISSWNVSNVTTMLNMFYNAQAFNQPIGSWNVGQVTSMQSMFNNSQAFNQAIGSWDVSKVTDMSMMFLSAKVFNQDLSLWNVANVTTMASMFYSASAFNQPVGSWNVGKVTAMSYMFGYAFAFDQNIGAWDVSQVTTMAGMFQSAGAFNQNIGGWTVSKVTNMSNMFSSAGKFNQNIGGWNVGLVTNMGSMFSYASAFNGDISTWNVSNVTDMSNMFGSAGKFNQNIGSWNVGKVTNMSGMFSGATIFNQDISVWNVGLVTNMSNMFGYAFAFNQNIGAWNISNVSNISNMFLYATLSTGNYNSLLIAWTAKTLKSNLTFSGGYSKYSCGDATTARAKLISTFGWTITDGGSPAEVTTLNVTDYGSTTATANGNISCLGSSNPTDYGICWNTTGNPTTSNSKVAKGATSSTGAYSVTMTGLTIGTTYYVRAYVTNASGTIYGNQVSFVNKLPMSLTFDTSKGTGTQVTLPLTGTVNVAVDWGDGTTENFNTAGNKNHDYASAGTYTVKISGSLTSYGFGSSASSNAEKLTTVTSFGDVGLTSLYGAFSGASNLTAVPISLPSTVTNLSYLFQGASKFNGAIGSWNVSNVITMYGMFQGADAFNQPIGSWNVSKVTDMSNLFYSAKAFNQDISNWNVSLVTNMNLMFGFATSFNQNIGSWDVSNVTTMTSMFAYATSFNQNIGAWNVSKVTHLSSMFQGAAAFNQNLGAWNVSNVTTMDAMFAGASAFDQNLGNWNITKVTIMDGMFWDIALSPANYDALLKGWAAQLVKNGVIFDGGKSKYSCGDAATARASLISTYGWTITDGGSPAEVSTQAVIGIGSTTATANGNISCLGSPNPTDYGICWNTSPSPTTSNSKVSKGAASATGAFTASMTGLAAGTTYYARAYVTNSTGTNYGQEVSFTTLLPMVLTFDTSKGTGTQVTLPLAGTVNVTVDWGDGATESFNTSGNKTHDYSSSGIYTVKISGSLTSYGFGSSASTNADKLTTVTTFGDLGLTSLSGAFKDASNLTAVPASLPSAVTDMSYMFKGASIFNGAIGSWNVSQVTNMSYLFANTNEFNQPIGSWNVSKVTDMGNMFNYAKVFNQDISNWNVGNVTKMLGMFNNASTFNQNIGNWDVSNVTDMRNMFMSAKNFDQNIGNWNTSNVRELGSMFSNASNFNQDISNWNMSKVGSTGSMFYNATAFNQNIGKWDLKNVVNMTHMFNGAVSFDQDISNWNIGNAKYMDFMFFGVSLSMANYDALLKSWSKQIVQSNVFFHAGNSKYSCEAGASKNLLINSYNWTITDGGSPAEVSTQPMTDIGMTTATANGNISCLGSPNPTDYGICWNTTGTPTTSNSKVSKGAASTTGAFTASMTGLTAGTTYYVRAYVTNATGTSYGVQVSFSPIVKYNQTINFPAIADKTYGDSNFTLGDAKTDEGLTITYTADDPSLVSITGNQAAILKAGITNITASQEGDVNHFAATSVVRSLTVTKATLTVTADAQTKVYGEVNPSLTFQYSGWKNSDTESVLDTKPTASTSVTQASNVGIYTGAITVTGGLDNNYDFIYVPADFTVNKTTLTVTADAQTKVYGDLNPSLTFQYSGWKNNDTESVLDTKPTASTTVTQPSNVETYANDITFSGGTDNNYDFTYVAADFTVTKATLTVTADAQTKVYGEANPSLTFQYSGWKNSDNQTVLDTKPTASTTVTQASNVGIYTGAITLTGGLDNNYTFSYDPADFTVNKATLTVRADAQTKVYGEVNPALTFQYSGWKNSDTESDLETKATAFTMITQSSNAGTYTNGITVSGGEENNYNFTYVAADFTVTKATLTVTADAQTKVYGEVNPSLTFQYSGWKNSDTESVLDTKPAASTTVARYTNAGSYAGAITLGGGFDNNYSLSLVPATFEVTKAVLKVRADNLTKVYGQENPSLSYYYSGWVNGPEVVDTAPVATTYVSNSSPAGSYIGAITLSGGSDNNYTFSFLPGNMEVIKAVLTVKADNQSRAYGQPNAPLTFSCSGWIFGPEVINTPPSLSTTVGRDSNAGFYPHAIAIGGGWDNNYELVLRDGDFTIAQAVLSLKEGFSVLSKAWDGTPKAEISGAVLSGVVNNDDVLLENASVGTFAQTEPGKAIAVTTNMLLSGKKAGNYSFSQPAGLKADILKRVITVTAQNISRECGEQDPRLGYDYSPNLVGDDQFVGTLARQQGNVPGKYRILQGSLSLGRNYELLYHEASFSIIDNAPMWMTDPSELDRIVEYNDEKGLAAAMALAPKAFDACDNNNPVVVKTTGAFERALDCFLTGTYTNTWTVMDQSGNAGTVFTQHISVVDRTLPFVTEYPSVQYRAEPGVCEMAIKYPEFAISELCLDKLELVSGLGKSGIFPLGSTRERWKMTDKSGNTAFIDFIVTITSYNEAPNADNIPDVTFLKNQSNPQVVLTGIHPGRSCSPQQVQWITAQADNKALVSDIQVEYSMGEPTGKLLFKLMKDAVGESYIHVMLKDNGGTDNRGVDTKHLYFKLTVDSPTAAENLYQVPSVTVYPNPSTGWVNIDMKDFGPSSVRIISSVGAEVFKISKVHGSSCKLNLAGQTPGIYVVEISNDKTTVVKKLILKK